MAYVKTPPPRPLVQNETLDSLNHWKTTFRNYYRRDAIFSQFLSTELEWTPGPVIGGNDDMSAADRKDALVDFLNQLAGFLPHSYLTSKLEQNSKSLNDCWEIIEEHYNVKVTSETLLDFEALKKEPAENYRQFFERLLQHSKLHLAPKNVKVENLKTDANGDLMTISLMNHIAVQWLRKIDIQLLNIVKTEYSTELRSNVQLAALVPRIAPNIDSLLARYSSANVNKVAAVDHHEEDDPNNVRFTGFRQRGENRGGYRGGNRGGNQSGNQRENNFRGGRGRPYNQGNTPNCSVRDVLPWASNLRLSSISSTNLPNVPDKELWLEFCKPLMKTSLWKRMRILQIFMMMVRPNMRNM